MSKGDPGTPRVAVTPIGDTGLVDLVRQAGLPADTTRDPAGWLRCHPGSVVVTNRTDDLPALAAAGRVVLLVDDPVAAAWARSHGVSTLPTTAGRDQLTSAVAASASGHQIAHRALLGMPTTLSSEHARLYRILVTLCHVTDIAERIGYSRTETYRRLAGLYRALGVANREQALYLAGLLQIRAEGP